MSAVQILRFGTGTKAAGSIDRTQYGSKGAGLAEMAAAGLPVPPGFILPVSVFHQISQAGRVPEELRERLVAEINWLEKMTGRGFGNAHNPLLVSVRSGAEQSMPGMLTTMLNVGLSRSAISGLGRFCHSKRTALAVRGAFIPQLAEAAFQIDPAEFDDLTDAYLDSKGLTSTDELEEGGWSALLENFESFIARSCLYQLPDNSLEQLLIAIRSVCDSWRSPRARTYRQIHGIPDEDGTAITVQFMVFGNLNEKSATGVAFSRNPSTGEPGLFGEFLPNAQGEALVSGQHTPQDLASMQALLPEAFSALERHAQTLEKLYHDVQDIEFTVEQGRLWLLQTRKAKRSARAAIRIAVDMAGDGQITSNEALCRIEPILIDQLLHPTIDTAAMGVLVTEGLPASPGAVSGEIVFTAGQAERLKGQGRPAILVRPETSPQDIHGMYAASGVLTAKGGMTSHAAVVARGLGKPCICGAGELQIDPDARTLTLPEGQVLLEGAMITLDGSSGEVFLGEMPMIAPEQDASFTTLMGWADECRRLQVRANADTPAEAHLARELGAEGIGLCRTEFTFFSQGRISAMQKMILAASVEERETALSELLPVQRADFRQLFSEMRGLPVTIRLLDLPLHEFLPAGRQETDTLAREMNMDISEVEARATALREFNPMLGHRGCRLAITYPEIYRMQVRAVIEAAADVLEETGQAVIPEIMIPVVSTNREIEILKAEIDTAATEVMKQRGARIPYRVGAMVETPRAALRAGQIAEVAEFISFGTNDLTQMTYGLSRDDSGRFMRDYIQRDVLSADPFDIIDEEGVGELIQFAIERGRECNDALALGICGEHGGNPPSIDYFERIGLDYISCSPYRTPVARLAAAQAKLRNNDESHDIKSS